MKPQAAFEAADAAFEVADATFEAAVGGVGNQRTNEQTMQRINDATTKGMNKAMATITAAGMALAAHGVEFSADFGTTIGPFRPELHSSGFGPTVCSQTADDMANIKAMGFRAARTHDWAIVNSGQRVCDYLHIFPLMHLDAKDPRNYSFAPTDYLLKRTREEMGVDVFFRLGTSIEHLEEGHHFNAPPALEARPGLLLRLRYEVMRKTVFDG